MPIRVNICWIRNEQICYNVFCVRLGMLLYVRKRLLQSGEGQDSGKAEKDKNSFHELEAAERYDRLQQQIGPTKNFSSFSFWNLRITSSVLWFGITGRDMKIRFSGN